MTLLEQQALERRAKQDGTSASFEQKRVGRPKGTAVARKDITEAEFNALIMHIDNSDMKPKMKLRYKRVVALSFYLGTRIGELLMLTVKDIRLAVTNFETSLPNRTKTKKSRHLMFTKKAVTVIEHLFEEYLDPDNAAKHQPHHYLFHSPRKPTVALNKSTWTKAFNDLIHEALGEMYSSHSFRAGLLGDLARRRINPRIAQRIAGHSSVTVTMGYYRPTEEDARTALDEVR